MNITLGRDYYPVKTLVLDFYNSTQPKILCFLIVNIYFLNFHILFWIYLINKF